MKVHRGETVEDPSYHLQRIRNHIASARPGNIGDILIEVIAIRKRINEPLALMAAETMLVELRSMAAGAVLGWRIFSERQSLPRPIGDTEVLQLITLERALHELCYACESVEFSSALGWGGSTSTRFYLNGIYHYVSSMFLLDTSSPRQKDLPSGGTVIRALYPLELGHLVDPVIQVLSQPLSPQITFGETILRLRHSYLVHGDFSPRRLEYLIAQSEIRIPDQAERFASLIWDLFYEIILLRLRIISLFTHEHIDVDRAIERYLSSV